MWRYITAAILLGVAIWKFLEQETAPTPERPRQYSRFVSESVTTCAICKEDFNNTDILSTLPCQHRFHRLCLKPILDNPGLKTCPCCRLPIN